jgi:hypothetical protein
MNKWLAVLTVLAVGALSASAGSGVGFYGSYWDSEDPGAGLGGGLKVKADLSDMLAFEVRASYVGNFEEDDNGATEEFFLVPLEADLLVQVPLGEKMKLYGGGGGGWYVAPEFETDNNVDIDPDDEFGFFGVGGIEFALSETFGLFAEAKYTVLEIGGLKVDNEDVDLRDEELDMTGLGVNVGVMYLW